MALKTRKMTGENYFEAIRKNKKLFQQGVISESEYRNFNVQALKLSTRGKDEGSKGK